MSQAELTMALAKAQGDRHAEAQIIPLMVGRKPTLPAGTDTLQRFIDKVAFGTTDCWYWTGSRNRLGYGCFNHMGESKAHRVAYSLARGPIPSGRHVLHRCDVRSCVNPDHLMLGTHADNMADMTRKGRGVQKPLPGEANPMAVLTADRVQEIRRLYAEGAGSMSALAKRYAVSTMTVCRLINRQTWGSVS